MLKLLLFGLACTLGYRLLRSLRPGAGVEGPRSRRGTRRDRAVEAEFEEVDEGSP